MRRAPIVAQEGQEMSDPVDERLAAVELTLGINGAKLDNLAQRFDLWCHQVYEQGIKTQEVIRSTVAASLAADLARETKAVDDQWIANEKDHATIIIRLDSLNGWRNKILGVMALMGVAAPLALGAWAIVTRG